VKILEHLGVHTIRLLPNNPKKAKGLEEYGVRVESCVPHIMQVHQHNEAYLETKAKRLGHVLPTENKEAGN
jgi:GTP cyclohydrolase II